MVFNKKHPVTINGKGIFGNLFDLQKDHFRLFLNCYQVDPDIVRLRFGPVYSYFISHPDYVKRVLKDNAKNYVRRTRGYAALKTVLGNGVLTSEGELWKEKRNALLDVLGKKNIENNTPLMCGLIKQGINHWDKYVEKEETINLFEEMDRLTLIVFSQILLGFPLEKYSSEIRLSRLQMSEILSRRMKRIWNYPIVFPTKENIIFRRANIKINYIIKEMIQSYKGGNNKGNCYLSILLDKRQGIKQCSVGLKEYQELKTFLAAGYETTAIMLTWALFLLSKNDAIKLRVRNELTACLGQRDPTFYELSNLKYAEQVLKEALRLYPPVWQISRLTVHSDKLGDYDIPPRASVVMSQYVTHRHKDFWDKPEVFDPDRFSAENERKIHPFAYFPFGGGPHNCLGYHFAMTEAKLILAYIIRRYDIVSANDSTVDNFKATFSLLPANDLLVKAKFI